MAYTQPPHLTDEELESFLKQAKVARFCSMNSARGKDQAYKTAVGE